MKDFFFIQGRWKWINKNPVVSFFTKLLIRKLFPLMAGRPRPCRGSLSCFLFYIWSVCQTVLPSVTRSECKETLNSQISGVGTPPAGSGTRLSGVNRERGASCRTRTRRVDLVSVPLYFNAAGARRLRGPRRPSGKKNQTQRLNPI